MRQTLVLINPKSGTGTPYRYISAIESVWDTPDNDISFQFSQSAEDGEGKVRRAIERGTDTVLVVGGDGMVNSIGSVLVGTDVRLGVIPAGSGNGFARHFGIPIEPKAAARALLEGETLRIDAGRANGRYFFITCSLAWDAALVEGFERFPFRGILPYVLGGAQQLFEYRVQPFDVEIDGKSRRFKQPFIFTVANLSQFGNDVLVAPDAQADSGDLELISIERKDVPVVISQVHRFIEKTFHHHPQVTNLHFHKMVVRRERPALVQIDGELLESVSEVSIEVVPQALSVLVPAKKEE